MKKLLFILLFAPLFSLGQPVFDLFFENRSFRFDFMLGGNSDEVNLYPQQMKLEGAWPGSMNNLIDSLNYGTYRIQVFNSGNKMLIYSKGFSTLFQEWQTTAEAQSIDRMFYHCLIFPFPQNTFILKIEERQWGGQFEVMYETEINPSDYFIIKESTLDLKSEDIIINGEPDKKVDLVILSEGYKHDEMNKFLDDVKRVTSYLFDEEPYKSSKSDFNVRAVLSPSVDSGTDIPGEGIYKNTAFNSSFYTFNVDRYLTSGDMKSIHDAAAIVPYDYIYLLVNSDRYGGGGIYNFLNICTSDNHLTKEVFIHEFGHGFAGLGDEYYSSSVAYENFYNPETEPWEPNLTTLVDFESKWAAGIHDSVPVPTPREQKYFNTTGVFEGGGYQSKGIYSPFMECRMKSNDAKGFCPVCTEAILRVIDNHCR